MGTRGLRVEVPSMVKKPETIVETKTENAYKAKHTTMLLGSEQSTNNEAY